eukprot:6109148-Pleurochrysis_carterae.AAC.2
MAQGKEASGRGSRASAEDARERVVQKRTLFASLTQCTIAITAIPTLSVSFSSGENAARHPNPQQSDLTPSLDFRVVATWARATEPPGRGAALSACSAKRICALAS